MIDQDGCAKQAFPAGEGGPQRRDISRGIREMIDAVAVDEVHHADAPSPKRTFSCKTNQIHRQNSTRKGLSDGAAEITGKLNKGLLGKAALNAFK